MKRALADDVVLEYRRGDVAQFEYARILRRYWLHVACLTILGTAMAGGMAVGLPPKYRSSATILVQQQQVPIEFVRPTVTSFADERISSITQRVMTAAVLAPMIDRHDLYGDQRERQDVGELVDRMREDIEVATIDAKVSDRASGQRVSTTVAFTIHYEASEPYQARAVVEELVAIFLEENERARQRSVAATTVFLREEANRIGTEIKGIEGRLADFKRLHQQSMPEAVEVNLQLAGRTELEVLTTQNRINVVKQRVESLAAQLAMAPRDVAEGGDSAGAGLSRLRLELAETRERYSDTHPDVRRLQRTVSSLQSLVDQERRSREAAPASNPAYLTLVEQLGAARAELAELQVLREEFVEKQRAYDERLLQAPEIEREYRDLTRDYENSQTRYREIRAKEMQAEIAEQLEADQKGERFAVIEPPSFPNEPAAPRRKFLAVLGLGAALGGGLGLAWLRDLLDPAIKSPLDLARLSQIPVLMPVPCVETRLDKAKAWSSRLGCLLLVTVLAAAAFAASYLLAPMAERFL